MPRFRNFLCALASAVLVAVLTGCGGGDDGTDTTARTETTATPTATATPADEDGGDDDGGDGGTKAPKGVSAKSVNAARDTIVEVCAQRDKKSGKPSEAESMADLREAADDLEEGFRANADSKFRRSPGTPPASMRDRLRAMALVLNTRCGDGDAKEVADQLIKTASAKKAKKKKKKPKPKKTATPTPTATATPTPTATPAG